MDLYNYTPITDIATDNIIPDTAIKITSGELRTASFLVKDKSTRNDISLIWNNLKDFLCKYGIK